MPSVECLFCRIRDKEIPAAIIYEDDATLAFLDILPRAPGHTMVIAKHHSETLAGLPDSEAQKLFVAVKRVGDELTKALDADGLTVGINQGEVSGQVVPHLHVHLIPRFKGDGGHAVQSVVHNPPKKTLKEVERMVRETHSHNK